LKTLVRHRKLLTALLLALYAFIATPVSLWHHHKVQSPISSSEQKISKATIANDSDANCSICQHQYASSNNDAIFFSLNAIKPTKSFTTFYSFPFLPSIAYSKQNKGPPFFS